MFDVVVWIVNIYDVLSRIFFLFFVDWILNNSSDLALELFIFPVTVHFQPGCW